jgi:hypothetical protein
MSTRFLTRAACAAMLAMLGACGNKPAAGLDAGLPDTGPAPTCSGGLALCSDNACHDLATDNKNCGACSTKNTIDKACSSGQICSGGTCAAACTGGTTQCDDGRCHDLATDNANCGACSTKNTTDKACASGQLCSGGTCAASCTDGTTQCDDGRCHDLATDNANCGTCSTKGTTDKACPSGQACSGGACAAGCSAGFTLCEVDGKCHDLTGDNANCGACSTKGTTDKACPAGQVCSWSKCAATCAPGLLLCGDGKCHDPASDNANCGACSTPGTTDKACATPLVCSAGLCAAACGKGLNLCSDGQCHDLLTDNLNCGTCSTKGTSDKACTASQVCSGGQCGASCATGTTQCGDGRCHDLSSDPADCGACSTTAAPKACKADEVCFKSKCGPPVVPCSVDDDCGPTDRCGDAGYCVAAVTCDTPANCVPSDDNDTKHLYCDNVVGLGCRCVMASTTPDGGVGTQGYCKRRLPPCATCTADEQCGNDPLFFKTPLHNPGHCVKLAGVSVCLEAYNDTLCACGQSTTIGGTAYCAPQGDPASCADGTFLCCTKDANCPPEHPVCDVAHGRCQDLCWYDYVNNETVGCRSDRVCNVEKQYVDDPNSRNYGAGKCGLPCTSDAECQQIRADFVCRAEAKSDKRCRPAGCIDDLECSNQVQDSPYTGYCERATGICVCSDPTNPAKTCNCRTGTNPVTNTPYRDCKEGFKCQQPQPGDPGQCVEKDCIEQGGAQNFCGWSQFCCGEDRDGLPNTPPEACTDMQGVSLADIGKCYTAPAPWCAACDDQNPIKSCTQAGFPGNKVDLNLCLAFGKDTKGNDRGNSCLFACDKGTECPKGFLCNDFVIDCSTDPTYCGDKGDCEDTGRKDAKGNPIKWCKCTTAGAKVPECPQIDSSDPTSATRCGDSLQPWPHCIYTHACMPQPMACQK